ncbi:MAG: DNA polymerase III subunit epsilon, partial [Proteobacteria bacterium]|nr:DNA polymerase III subunit epsilon [Pseudomonadota bacterium]
MREIVLDTETTGLSPNDGHRIVEIGCLELENHIATGETFHCYANPDRPMPAEAFAVHGLSDEFLAGQQPIEDHFDGFLNFIGDAPLVIHNAEFDMRFLNAELDRVDRAPLAMARTIDTVRMARQKFPGAPASLDALCRRFEIDNSSRTYHGALLDAQLLAEVWARPMGGRQPGLELSDKAKAAAAAAADRQTGERREPRPHAASAEEEVAH